MKKYDVLDFDKTIYKKDSSKQFFLFCMKKNPALIRYIPGIIVLFLLYYLKLIEKEKVKQYFFKFLKDFDNIDEIVEEFWNINKKDINYKLLEKCDNEIIIISASPEFLLKNICHKLGVKKLIATKVNKKNGEFETKNCHGEEKTKRLYNELENFEVDRFYSDSLSDEPLARMSNRPYIIKNNKIKKWNFNNEKLKNVDEIIRYLFIGVLTMIITLVSYYLLTVSFLSPNNKVQLQIANIISWAIAVVFSYICNRKFVFRSRNNNCIKEFINFVVSRFFTLLVDMLGMFLMVTILTINDKFSKCVVQLLVVILNYIISKFIVFRGRKNEKNKSVV